MLEALKDLPREPLVYEVGGIVFASALMGFAHLMRVLMNLVGRKSVWLFPFGGAVLMLVAVGLHAYANFFLLPFVEPGSDVIMQVYRFRFIALLAMLSASILTLAGTLVFWTVFTGSRRKA